MGLNRENRLVDIVVLLFGVIALIYGFFYLVVPAWYLNAIGASSVPLVHIRWPGGVLLALAFGAWKYYRDPAKGEIYLATLIAAPLLGGLALLFSLATGEYDGNGIFYAFPGVMGVVISVLLIWGSRRS